MTHRDARWDGLSVFVDEAPPHFLNGPAPQCPQDALATQLLLIATTLQPTHTERRPITPLTYTHASQVCRQRILSNKVPGVLACCLDKWGSLTYLCLSATRQSKAVKSRGEPGPLVCRALHTPLCSSFQSRTWHCRPEPPHRPRERGGGQRPSQSVSCYSSAPPR